LHPPIIRLPPPPQYHRILVIGLFLPLILLTFPAFIFPLCYGPSRCWSSRGTLQSWVTQVVPWQMKNLLRLECVLGRSRVRILVLLTNNFVFFPTQPLIQWVTRALPLGVKRLGREVDQSPPSSADVRECVELYLQSSNTPSWHSDNFTFTSPQSPQANSSRLVKVKVSWPCV
jgi:hypothetical protein